MGSQRWHSRPYPSRSWYSIKRPRRVARLSWPRYGGQMSSMVIFGGHVSGEGTDAQHALRLVWTSLTSLPWCLIVAPEVRSHGTITCHWWVQRLLICIIKSESRRREWNATAARRRLNTFHHRLLSRPSLLIQTGDGRAPIPQQLCTAAWLVHRIQRWYYCG